MNSHKINELIAACVDANDAPRIAAAIGELLEATGYDMAEAKRLSNEVAAEADSSADARIINIIICSMP